MESKLITVSGVTGYEDKNGTAYLRLEDVARGLGFTESKDGREYVMWRRVVSYLQSFGTSAEDGNMPEFIPENIFYRLAFKAKNEVAERFQSKVADEVLPAIRRTGTYSVKPMTEAELIAAQANLLVKLQNETSEAKQIANQANKKINGALDVLAKPPAADWQTATNDCIRGMALNYCMSFPVLFGDMYKELENTAHVNLQSRVSRLQGRLKKSGATYRERQEITKLHVISLDPKLKLAFDGIVRRYAAKYQIGSEI